MKVQHKLYQIQGQCQLWREARKTLHEPGEEIDILKADTTRPPGHWSYGKIES